MKKGDFTLYEKKGNIYSLDMQFNNSLRKANLPAMSGGKKSELGVPIGLTLINNYTNDFNEENSQYGGVIKGELYDRLLNMSGQNPKTNKKTKKAKRKKKRRRKTRKI